MAKLKYKDKDGFWQELPVGTNVVANPALTGTEQELTSLQVGNVKYKSGGGKLYLHKISASLDIDGGNIYIDMINTSDTLITENEYFKLYLGAKGIVASYTGMHGGGAVRIYPSGTNNYKIEGAIATIDNTGYYLNVTDTFSSFSDTYIEI